MPEVVFSLALSQLSYPRMMSSLINVGYDLRRKIFLLHPKWIRRWNVEVLANVRLVLRWLEFPAVPKTFLR